MSAPSRVRFRGRRATHGYTAVEVLLAMTVLIISTAGVMSMQKASIQGNLDARKLDVANAIARTWLDRLAADATTWNSAAPIKAQTLVLSTLAPATVSQGTFQVSPLSVSSMNWSPAFDILGRDVATLSDPSIVFCTHVKVDTMAVDPATSAPTILRATVMVFWATSLAGGPAPATSLCSATGPADVAKDSTVGTYHTIFATEALRRAS